MNKMSKSRLNFKSNTLPAIVMVGPVVIIMVLLIAVPLIYVGIMSFCSIDEFYNVTYNFTFENYFRLANQDYLKIYSQSIFIAFITTLLCILIGYPFSYFIARTKSKKKKILYMLVIIPFWTNSLIRIYGWRTFLGTNGWLNIILQRLSITDSPIDFLYKNTTTILGMVYCLIPFMIMPLYTSIEKLDGALLEASSDLGAKPVKTFVNVILPLTSGGIFSGSLMVFIPCLGYFFVSDILGGGNSDVIGNLIERQFQGGNNWPLGAALSIVLIAVTLVLVKLYQKLGGDMDALGV